MTPGNRLRPILQFQSLDTLKLPGIVRNQGNIQRFGVGGDQKVIGANQGSFLLQIGANDSVFPGRVSVEGDNMYAGKKSHQGKLVL